MKLYISILLLLVTSTGCGFNSPKEVSISQVIADYQESAEAPTKYRGQTLIFTATVSDFAELDEFIQVDLEDGRVICFIDKSSHPDAFSKLKRGETSTFKGVVTKETISLTSCEIK
jgi:hypothetical protein